MKHPSAYDNQKVVVLGLAKSGRAVAKIFHGYGAKVTVNDKKERALCPDAESLEAIGISVICGHHPDHLIDEDTALIVKNPGIPYYIPPIQRAIELGIEIVTEVEVAYMLRTNKLIGITGSNGKTTTTTWLGEMLEVAGQKPMVAGNIGKPLCEAALEANSDQWMVVELSSFQLKGTRQFRPQIACLLNLSETHLDYHGTIEDYKQSKARLFANQTEEDIVVINWDDTFCRLLIPELKAHVMPFSLSERLNYGVCVIYDEATSAEWIAHRSNGDEQLIMQVSKLGVPGSYNVENALAVTAIALQLGLDVLLIAQVLQDFRGVEHRMEYVAMKNDVSFYNNSKATNPLATIRALETFEQNIILIAGGLDRGTDYMELGPALKDKVKGIVVLGETKEKMIKVAEQSGVSLIKAVSESLDVAKVIEEAVAIAYKQASKGDVVLLSPACASWDMFESFEERGRMFKDAVHNL